MTQKKPKLLAFLDFPELVRKAEDKQWVSANSKEGQVILQKFFQPNEEGKVANYHLPE